MTFAASSLAPVAPEIFLLCMASAILVIDLFLAKEQKVWTYFLTQLALIGTAFLVIGSAKDSTEIVLSGAYVRDGMADTLKAAICLTSAVAFVYSRGYLVDRGLMRGEYFVLGLFAVLGMMVLVSANGFLSLYLGLELLALSLYALVAFDRDSREGSEAAMKYFVLGALASGLLLYGISMIYGATGSLEFSAVSSGVTKEGVDTSVLVFGLVFLIIGVAFKLGAVPFHMWIPDVYQGAPTAVTLFISTAPKLAGFALAMRLLVDGMGSLHDQWQGMLIVLAVLSMGLGNLVAIAQTNIKRMLAYSTISHVGFILLGILSGSAAGYSAAMFYSITYAIMALGSFGIVIFLSRKGFEADSLDDFRGLNDRSPWFAGMMLLLMFSMAGVPPTVGFFAKLVVLQAVIEVDLVWLAAVGVFFSIIGAFYYIRIVKLMYFDKPTDPHPLQAGLDVQAVLSVNGFAILILGMFPSGLLSLCAAALG